MFEIQVRRYWGWETVARAQSKAEAEEKVEKRRRRGQAARAMFAIGGVLMDPSWSFVVGE